MSGIKDVASLAGVSISTVSNVLNGTKYVSPELVKKVEKAVEELAYHANPIARSMKSNKTGIIGVIVEDLGGVFYPYIVKGIDEVANEMNYQMIICDAGGAYEHRKSIIKEENFFRRLAGSRVDGILFVSCVPEDKIGNYITKIKKIVNEHKITPLVSLERDLSKYGIDSVYFDSYQNAKIAVQHLIDMRCKNIAMITGPDALHVAKQRTDGFIDILNDNNLLYSIQKQTEKGDYTHQSGYSSMKKLLAKNPKIDGVFIANDQMAVGALKYLKKNNILVPQTIKIIGYDDIFFSNMIDPSLSTIHIRKRHAGIEAAKILFSRIQNKKDKNESISMKIDSRLIIRNSTMKTDSENWNMVEW